jgi:hypothetical protein
MASLLSGGGNGRKRRRRPRPMGEAAAAAAAAAGGVPLQPLVGMMVVRTHTARSMCLCVCLHACMPAFNPIPRLPNSGECVCSYAHQKKHLCDACASLAYIQSNPNPTGWPTRSSITNQQGRRWRLLSAASSLLILLRLGAISATAAPAAAARAPASAAVVASSNRAAFLFSHGNRRWRWWQWSTTPPSTATPHRPLSIAGTNDGGARASLQGRPWTPTAAPRPRPVATAAAAAKGDNHNNNEGAGTPRSERVAEVEVDWLVEGQEQEEDTEGTRQQWQQGQGYPQFSRRQLAEDLAQEERARLRREAVAARAAALDSGGGVSSSSASAFPSHAAAGWGMAKGDKAKEKELHRHDARFVLPMEEGRGAEGEGVEGGAGHEGGSGREVVVLERVGVPGRQSSRLSRWVNRLDCSAGAWALSSPSTVRTVKGLQRGEEGERRGIHWPGACLCVCLCVCASVFGGKGCLVPVCLCRSGRRER